MAQAFDPAPVRTGAVTVEAAGSATRTVGTKMICWIRSATGSRSLLEDLGGLLLRGAPADFGKLITGETEKWAGVVKFAGIGERNADPLDCPHERVWGQRASLDPSPRRITPNSGPSGSG
jgi:hypothetical protein